MNHQYTDLQYETYSLNDAPPVMYPISQPHQYQYSHSDIYAAPTNADCPAGYAVESESGYDNCFSFVNTPETYAYTASPSSTVTDDGSTSSSTAGYYYSGLVDSFSDKVCAAADSSSQSPHDLGGSKPKKRRSPEVQQRQRSAANERERRRMMSINKAFESLRSRIPTLPYEKRLSKVDTLRLTIGYIHILEDLLRNDDEMRASNADDGESAKSASENSRQTNFSCGRHLRPPPPKKVVIECHSAGSSYEEEMMGVSPVRAHSLSWNRHRESYRGNPTLTAKLWVPQPASSSSAEHQQTVITATSDAN